MGMINFMTIKLKNSIKVDLERENDGISSDGVGNRCLRCLHRKIDIVLHFEQLYIGYFNSVQHQSSVEGSRVLMTRYSTILQSAEGNRV